MNPCLRIALMEAGLSLVDHLYSGSSDGGPRGAADPIKIQQIGKGTVQMSRDDL